MNAAITVETTLKAADLLKDLHRIEALAGRTREQRWSARTLDLDLVAFGDEVLPDVKTHSEWVDLSMQDQLVKAPSDLIVPHPRIQDRAFVLIPLRDVAPDWTHPVTGKGIDAMIDALDPADVADVKPITI